MVTSSTTHSYFLQQFINPLMAGACAGLAVDISLYPIDTIKTRLQSVDGFWKTGGFSRIYSGIGSSISGSAPSAALFFITYESGKYLLKEHAKIDQKYEVLCYMTSASLGETMACLIRVPVEVVKQRAQAFHLKSLIVLRQTIHQSGFRGLYRGYTSTIMREIPFSMIQFPLWEASKQAWAHFQQRPIQPYQAMICGSFAGGLSAFITTPLDVAKTQIMLQDFHHSDLNMKKTVNVSEQRLSVPVNYLNTIKTIFIKKGIHGLFAGAVPRVLWISIGGAIFLGGYEVIYSSLNNGFIER